MNEAFISHTAQCQFSAMDLRAAVWYDVSVVNMDKENR